MADQTVSSLRPDVKVPAPPVRAAVTDRNPTGITLTQAQKDEFEREGCWSDLIRYGLSYYVSGRFAAAHRFVPVSANILHHAVEYLLKGCLAQHDSVETIREYGKRYGHNIKRLWKEFKGRQSVPVPPEFDAIISSLHKFERIRYPQTLVREGALITIGLFVVDPPPASSGQIPEKKYALALPQIDRLMGLLFGASGANPEAFLPDVTNDEKALEYYALLRSTIFGRQTQ